MRLGPCQQWRGFLLSGARVSLNSLSRAVDDLNAHTRRLEAAKARRAELRLELDAVTAVIESAQSAIATTEKLVRELAEKVGQ